MTSMSEGVVGSFTASSSRVYCFLHFSPFFLSVSLDIIDLFVFLFLIFLSFRLILPSNEQDSLMISRAMMELSYVEIVPMYQTRQV